MSIKEAVAKLAARANADGYGLTYTVSSGKKICTLELSRNPFRVQTTFSDTFIVACCDSGLIEKVLRDNYENLKFFLEAMLNND